MAIDEREMYFAHTLDVAWIIALWHWIHGGDPAREGVAAQTTELMARALVGHLSDTKAEAPNDIIEKLGSAGHQSYSQVRQRASGDKDHQGVSRTDDSKTRGKSSYSMYVNHQRTPGLLVSDLGIIPTGQVEPVRDESSRTKTRC